MIGGLRLNVDLYEKLMVFAKQHDCSVQEIIRFILNTEIDNYENPAINSSTGVYESEIINVPSMPHEPVHTKLTT